MSKNKKSLAIWSRDTMNWIFWSRGITFIAAAEDPKRSAELPRPENRSVRQTCRGRRPEAFGRAAIVDCSFWHGCFTLSLVWFYDNRFVCFDSKKLMCPSQASERKKLPLDGVLRRCMLGITWRVLASARKNLARDSVWPVKTVRSNKSTFCTRPSKIKSTLVHSNPSVSIQSNIY